MVEVPGQSLIPPNRAIAPMPLLQQPSGPVLLLLPEPPPAQFFAGHEDRAHLCYNTHQALRDRARHGRFVCRAPEQFYAPMSGPLLQIGRGGAGDDRGKRTLQKTLPEGEMSEEGQARRWRVPWPMFQTISPSRHGQHLEERQSDDHSRSPDLPPFRANFLYEFQAVQALSVLQQYTGPHGLPVHETGLL